MGCFGPEIGSGRRSGRQWPMSTVVPLKQCLMRSNRFGPRCHRAHRGENALVPRVRAASSWTRSALGDRVRSDAALALAVLDECLAARGDLRGHDRLQDRCEMCPPCQSSLKIRSLPGTSAWVTTRPPPLTWLWMPRVQGSSAPDTWVAALLISAAEARCARQAGVEPARNLPGSRPCERFRGAMTIRWENVESQSVRLKHQLLGAPPPAPRAPRTSS
jgi:hypothetical protein